MLPAASRLRRRPDFTATVRRGRRAGRQRLVVHVDVPDQAMSDQAMSDQPTESLDIGRARVGFVVSRTVGTAVRRNRARRQLRHLMADRLATLPAGARVVIRVLPAAVGASSVELAADLDAALARARRPVPEKHGVSNRTGS